MEKIPLWKRVGSWLGRSQEPMGEGQMVNLDAEGLLVDAEVKEKESSGPNLMVRGKKDQQLAALEDGFGRLVEVLESINDNVTQQREQATELKSNMERIGEALLSHSENSQDKKAISELTSELRSQAVRQQKVAEVVGSLPELTQAQMNKLSEIARQLEASGETEVQMVESFNRFDNSVQGMVNNSNTQTATLREMSVKTEGSQARLQEVVAKQNRLLLWAILILSVLSLAAVGAAIAALIR
ncbi:MAG: hypothetical protein JXD22_10370 [Sedimentisphaerales bacterium]|nr:hypothetical protein [Sedimentisphaerales bacterium]